MDNTIRFTLTNVTPTTPATPEEQARALEIALMEARKILESQLKPTGFLHKVESFPQLAYQLSKLGFSDSRIGSLIIGSATEVYNESHPDAKPVDRIVRCPYCKHAWHLGKKNAHGQYTCKPCGHLFRFCGTCLHTLTANAKKCKHCGRPNV